MSNKISFDESIETRLFHGTHQASDAKVRMSRNVQLAQTSFGPMLCYQDDKEIGAWLMHAGNSSEVKIKEVVEVLKQNCSFVPETFIDVGANIGTHLIFALKSCGFTRSVGFEPDRDNFKLLLSNVILNDLAASTQVFNIGVSDQDGTGVLARSNVSDGDHRLLCAGGRKDFLDEADRKTEEVPVATLDSFFFQAEMDWRRTLMWLDTQGLEGHILMGFKRSLKQGAAPYLVLEFSPVLIEVAGGSEFYFEFLSSCSKIYNISANIWWQHGQISVDNLRTLYAELTDKTDPSYAHHCDLLCFL